MEKHQILSYRTYHITMINFFLPAYFLHYLLVPREPELGPNYLGVLPKYPTPD